MLKGFFTKRSGVARSRHGLAAAINRSYTRATIAVVTLIVLLYGGFLADQLYYASSRGIDALRQAQVASYPWQGAIVMIGVTLLLAPLLGGLFGALTTRGIVRRVQQLAQAVTQFGTGDTARRVAISGNDEIGQLEAQFNRMAEQLAKSMANREALTQENARLAERTRIARELHDAISQDLFSLRMLTDGLHQALPTNSPLQPRISAVEQAAQRMLREMRALLLELRPSRLEHASLASALQELASTYRDRCDVTVTTAIVTVPLAAQIEHTLLRIAQEALSNAVRHGEATTIRLTLELCAETVVLTIADDGKGFSCDEPATQHGLGLILMQERVHELGGCFTLHTAPGQGTCIVVSLPQEVARDPRHDC